jgi:large subunit ribosomal protein L17
MNKKKKGRKLSRERGQRRALLKVLAQNLVVKERIETTRAKAKEAAVFVEKAITTAKKQNLAARRKLFGVFPERAATKLVTELATRYQSRPGGYTRILKLGPRGSDAADMVIIELVK